MDVTWASAVFFITELKPMTGWKQVSKSGVVELFAVEKKCANSHLLLYSREKNTIDL